MYRPLPHYVTVGPSDIEGLGLFATEPIPASTSIGVSHYFSKVGTRYEMIRTPLGGFYNYSDDPNCYSIVTSGFAELCTSRSIEVGEELTTSYSITGKP